MTPDSIFSVFCVGVFEGLKGRIISGIGCECIVCHTVPYYALLCLQLTNRDRGSVVPLSRVEVVTFFGRVVIIATKLLGSF